MSNCSSLPPYVVDDNHVSEKQAGVSEFENGNDLDVDGADDNDVEPAEPEVECKIYRVRSFTTKKGGTVVNRGDSIKVCSRRGSRQDVMLLAAPSGESALRRRNSTSGPVGSGSRSRLGLQQDADLLGSSVRQRRNSINCISLQLTDHGGASPARRRSLVPSSGDSAAAALDGSLSLLAGGRRASLRSGSIPTGSDLILTTQTSPSRRGSIAIIAAVGPEVQADVDELTEEDGVVDAVADGHVTEVFRVMVIGSHGVGKTTLTQQLLTSEYLANNTENEQGQ
jgi:hypothetical protein